MTHDKDTVEREAPGLIGLADDGEGNLVLCMSSGDPRLVAKYRRTDLHQDAIESAVLKERERCADIARQRIEISAEQDAAMDVVEIIYNIHALTRSSTAAAILREILGGAPEDTND